MAHAKVAWLAGRGAICVEKACHKKYEDWRSKTALACTLVEPELGRAKHRPVPALESRDQCD